MAGSTPGKRESSGEVSFRHQKIKKEIIHISVSKQYFESRSRYIFCVYLKEKIETRTLMDHFHVKRPSRGKRGSARLDEKTQSFSTRDFVSQPRSPELSAMKDEAVRAALCLAVPFSAAVSNASMQTKAPQWLCCVPMALLSGWWQPGPALLTLEAMSDRGCCCSVCL